MKHIIPTLTLTTLAAASAVAQSAASKGNGLSNDRIGLSFAQSGDADYMTLSTSAALNEYLVVSAGYIDVGGDIEGLKLDGRILTMGVTGKANVGKDGEVSIGYRYGLGAVAAGGFLADVGEQDAIFLGYRHNLGSGFEVGLSVAKLKTETVVLNYLDLGEIDVTPVTLSLRYNVGMVDFTLAYSTEDAYGLAEDEDTISLGIGINF